MGLFNLTSYLQLLSFWHYYFSVSSSCERKYSRIERKFKNTKSQPQQHLSLAKLTEERFELRDSAAQLSEKYEDLRDNEGNLVARIEAVLNAIQRRLPVTTDAEIRMQRQLQSIDRKNKDLTNGKGFFLILSLAIDDVCRFSYLNSGRNPW